MTGNNPDRNISRDPILVMFLSITVTSPTQPAAQHRDGNNWHRLPQLLSVSLRVSPWRNPTRHPPDEHGECHQVASPVPADSAIAFGKGIATEDTEIKEVRERKPDEVIGNEAQERLIEGNHEGTKTQSFSWCLCVLVVQIPRLSQFNIILAPSIRIRNEKLRCRVSQWYDARSDLWGRRRLPACMPTTTGWKPIPLNSVSMLHTWQSGLGGQHTLLIGFVESPERRRSKDAVIRLQDVRKTCLR